MYQGCVLRKWSPVLLCCEIQCAQHKISMKKLRFSSHPRAKVKRQGTLGTVRALPWYNIYYRFHEV